MCRLFIRDTDTLHAHPVLMKKMSHFVQQGYEPKIAVWVMSDMGDLSSPAKVGSRSTRVDPKLFGKPSDFSGDRREWRHFEWIFRKWFGFLYDTAEEWLDQAGSAPGELGEEVPDRRETDRSVVHESGHGVQERGSGFGENSDLRARL